ncbi:MAG: FtsX-like permease family protein [Proteobacteria bacterium]|nr:FtsX-like permease family protein [Pseudomonadota bacterium]MBU1686698.1 FtsX-like permease family protein [Pseudomonadota bacterium]
MIGAMGFAGFIMIFYAALMEGLLHTTEQNATVMESGQFQVHAPEYRDDPDLYTMITQEVEVLNRLQANGYQAAPRLFGVGLAAAHASSVGIMLRGIDPDRERLVTEIHRHLLAGKWLNGDDPEGVVVGRRLAKALGLVVGDELVVVSQAGDGSMANELYRVRGVLKSINESIDRSGVFFLDEVFRKLMVLPDGVHEIAIRSPDDTYSLADHTQQIQNLVPDLEVKNWRELQPVVARVIDMSRYSLLLMLVITYSAVGILTLNGMLMGVFERIHEFGVVKALGVPPWQIFSLIAIESFLQVVFASIIALAAGIPLSLYFETHPLDLTGLASSSASIAGIALDPLWYCRVSVKAVVDPIVVLMVVAMLSIIYPATKAALLKPLAAIHHR